MAERVCIICGSEKYYAKKLCRACYGRYLRSGSISPEEFASWEKNNGILKDKLDVIRAIKSTIKLNYSELARVCGVSRQAVDVWFKQHRCVIPSKHIDKAYEWMLNEAKDAITILSDFCA